APPGGPPGLAVRHPVHPPGEAGAVPPGALAGRAERGSGDAHRGDPPALLGEPERLGPLPAPRVQRRPRRQARRLRDELRVGPRGAVPAAVAAVALFPVLGGELLGHRLPLVVGRPLRSTGSTAAPLPPVRAPPRGPPPPARPT